MRRGGGAVVLAIVGTYASLTTFFVPPLARREAAVSLLLPVFPLPAQAIKNKAADEDAAEMDKLGSMLEKKWEKVKPRCTSLKMTGIKAGYGVSKKKELEDTVVCDDGGKPDSESKDKDWQSQSKELRWKKTPLFGGKRRFDVI